MARVLIACEFSGIVRDAFRARGHDAWSCDLLESERPGPHLQGDVRDVLADGWDLMIAHPPCTYLSRAGARWFRIPERERSAQESLAFVLALWTAPIPRVAIENPIGRLNKWWRYPDQTIEPWYFGDPYIKRTCLWLRGVPPLMAARVMTERRYWIDAYPGRPNVSYRDIRGEARTSKDRSRTFPGIASAMADQWGSVVAEERVA